MTTLLVTGGAGFIGSAVVRRAVAMGRRVINLDALTYAACLENLTSVAKEPGYSFEQAWNDYRWYSFAGYVMAVVASILVVRTDRGDDMFMVMAHRHGQQALDLGALELVAAGR